MDCRITQVIVFEVIHCLSYGFLKFGFMDFNNNNSKKIMNGIFYIKIK